MNRACFTQNTTKRKRSHERNELNLQESASWRTSCIRSLKNNLPPVVGQVVRVKINLALITAFIVFSCQSKSTNLATNTNDSLHMDNSTVQLVPNEILDIIDSTVVFAIVSTGTWKGDYLSNKIMMVDNKGSFFRLENTSLPDNKYFNASPKKYHVFTEAGVQKLNNYLEFLLSADVKVKYLTPENIKISGGMNHYVYVNYKERKKWIFFEPGATLIDDIEKKLDSLFIEK